MLERGLADFGPLGDVGHLVMVYVIFFTIKEPLSSSLYNREVKTPTLGLSSALVLAPTASQNY